MKTDNRRKEAKAKAKTKGKRESFFNLGDGAMVDKAERKQLLLPGVHWTIYQPTIEMVVNELNIQDALKAVIRNKGAPGIDNMQVQELEAYLYKHWPEIKKSILDGSYSPKPVRQVEIPKPNGGGVRQLGIPTVLDRVIQQAIYQVILPIFDADFSDYSYGFRPFKSAIHAVLQAHEYLQEGCDWVVDIDLEKFFDRVNHDMLMARVARKVSDKTILLLIRKFLTTGAMINGVVAETNEGTPQGGPLSPLLSNILLDDFDKELEKRGLRFVRYADDCNIYVKSEKAGLRVMKSLVRYLTHRLKLKVNQQKSAVDHPWNRKFLGYTFTEEKQPNRIRIHQSKIKQLKDKIRTLHRKLRGSDLSKSIRRLIIPITRGWANYFRLTGLNSTFDGLDGWIRRKLRGILWRQWKKPQTRRKRLLSMGLSKKAANAYAYSSKGAWRMARTPGLHKAVTNRTLEKMGYIPMAKMV